MNIEYNIQETLLFMIYYWLFLFASVLSVAQTTVLIGVNPCLTGSDLKKQSQFIKGQNKHKANYNKEIW